MTDIKYAQDFLAESATGEHRGGFNSRLFGDSLSKNLSGLPNGNRWGERYDGWSLADKMVREGEIFSFLPDSKVAFKCYRDGNAWCCVGDGFINLQESDNYTFGDSFDEAVKQFSTLTQG